MAKIKKNSNGKKYSKKENKKYVLTDGVLYPIYLTGDTHLHMTNGNEKLGPGVWNYSLLPGDAPLTLKNGIQLTNIAGSCGGCCERCLKNCYAKRLGIFRHSTCIPAWGENTVLAKLDPEAFFNEMQKFINRTAVSVIRAHMAGEFFSYKYMKSLNDFAAKNSEIIFYFYTKRYEWLEKLMTEEGLAENFRPTVSIWKNNYDNPMKFHEFIYDDGTDPELEKVFHCPAVDKNGHETGMTCAACKRCQKAKRGMKTAVYAH